MKDTLNKTKQTLLDAQQAKKMSEFSDFTKALRTSGYYTYTTPINVSTKYSAQFASSVPLGSFSNFNNMSTFTSFPARFSLNIPRL